MSDSDNRLAFCVFKNQIHIAYQLENDLQSQILHCGDQKLEAALFDLLSSIVKRIKFNRIITTAGPAPFTQLRILRSVQLGLATGFQCTAPMINTFDVLFAAYKPKEKTNTTRCLLETRRGDYFYQTRQNGEIIAEGTTLLQQHTDNEAIISDDDKISNVSIDQNLAYIMLNNNFKEQDQLLYGINLPYRIPTA